MGFDLTILIEIASVDFICKGGTHRRGELIREGVAIAQSVGACVVVVA